MFSTVNWFSIIFITGLLLQFSAAVPNPNNKDGPGHHANLDVIQQDPAPTTTDDSVDPTASPGPREPCDEPCEFQAVDCHTYYTCVNHTYKEYHACPAEENLAFNPAIGLCDVRDKVPGCQRGPIGPCECGYRGHQYDCTKFFYCEDTCNRSTCAMRSCPGALKWSGDFYNDGSQVMQCTNPKDIKCATKLPNFPVDCNGRTSGNYRNPSDCKSYWYCPSSGNGYVSTCSSSTPYFNPETKQCVSSSSFNTSMQIKYCMIDNSDYSYRD